MAYTIPTQSFFCIGYAGAGERLPSPYRIGGCEAITVQCHRATSVPLPYAARKRHLNVEYVLTSWLGNDSKSVSFPCAKPKKFLKHKQTPQSVPDPAWPTWEVDVVKSYEIESCSIDETVIKKRRRRSSEVSFVVINPFCEPTSSIYLPHNGEMLVRSAQKKKRPKTEQARCEYCAVVCLRVIEDLTHKDYIAGYAPTNNNFADNVDNVIDIMAKLGRVVGGPLTWEEHQRIEEEDLCN
ncbi:unnamed protein product [Orchesella dallaii]|uniref:Uncharacterized protein n=1 Tax=Orchesella dallaii TaxID=48710 RepID=A0ABP1PZP6_9HEXA